MLGHAMSPWLTVKAWLAIQMLMCRGRQEVAIVQACLLYELFVLAGLQRLGGLLQSVRQNGGDKPSRAL